MAGAYFSPAATDHLAGWDLVRKHLKVDERGHPRLRILSNCEHLIRTLPDLTHDKNRPDDIPETQERHAADALRYMLMARVFPAAKYRTRLLPRVTWRPMDDVTGW